MSRLFPPLAFSLLALTTSAAQNPPDLLARVRQYRQQHEVEIIRQYADLLSIPNLASDKPNIRRNAERIQAMLKERGVQARLLEMPDTPPTVFGELLAPGARHTLVIYAHYDGQPVDAAQWSSPPWQPVVRDQQGNTVALDSLKSPINGESRIYARSASDDKAPIEALMAALDALKAAGAKPTVNLKFFFEGEEEAGSPHLRAAIERYRDLLSGDGWLICDGPVHQTRRMQVYFGARGVTDVEMTIYGPIRSLHSGHYGNWAQNPAAMLANLLAAMRDQRAHISIPGFYDDVRPLSASEQKALDAVPNTDPQLLSELQLAQSEDGEANAKAITYPALNIRGIEAGHVGSKAQNAVPTEATASIDFRLVPDQTPEKVQQRVEDFIRQQGYFVVRDTPDASMRRTHPKIIRMNWGSGYPAARSSMDLPFSRAIVAAIERATGSAIIRMPTLGGSVPMYLFTDVLKAPVVGVPIVNHDNNQHAANENLRLQNLWDGIEVFASILANSEETWPK